MVAQKSVQQGLRFFLLINQNLEAVATAITNVTRSQGTASDGLSKATVQGTAYRTTVCTQFDWAWLAFPVALLFLTIALLAIMALKTMFDEQREVVHLATFVLR